MAAMLDYPPQWQMFPHMYQHPHHQQLLPISQIAIPMAQLNPDAPEFKPQFLCDFEAEEAKSEEIPSSSCSDSSSSLGSEEQSDQGGEAQQEASSESKESSSTEEAEAEAEDESAKDDSAAGIQDEEEQEQEGAELGDEGDGDPICSTVFCYYPSPVAISTTTSRLVSPSSIARVHSSRALVLWGFSKEASPALLYAQLGQWGAVRRLDAEAEDGRAIVHFYDVRHAAQCLQDLQSHNLYQQHKYLLLRRQEQLQMFAERAVLDPECSGDEIERLRNETGLVMQSLEQVDAQLKSTKVLLDGLCWAQFFQPDATDPELMNQGTLVVFNLEADISIGALKEAFQKYGDVKEIREAPVKKTHKFVEFFDVREAAAALEALNGTMIGSNAVKIEFSRPGGARNKKEQQQQQAASIPNANSSWQTVRTSSEPLIIHEFPASAASPWPLVHWNPWWGYYNPYWNAPQYVQGQVPAYYSSQFGYYCWRPASSYEVPCLPPAQQYANHQQQQQQLPIDRRYRKKSASAAAFDAEWFRFNENGDELGRTTLMIKNIPNKYSQQTLLEKFEIHCRECNATIDDPEHYSAFDFLYLPVDFRYKCNLGYAFINFTTVEATVRFYRAFHNVQWERYNKRKICEISYARIQGRDALRDLYKSRQGSENIPLVFDPPKP